MIHAHHIATSSQNTLESTQRSWLVRLIGHWSWLRTIVLLLAVAAACTLMYPTAGQWFSDKTHATEVSGYVHQANTMAPDEVNAQIEEARAYNKSLENGPYTDPNGGNSNGDAEYERLLNVNGQGMMGQLLIPSIGVSLPIYHDTSESSLDNGVGHLFGTGLPVGGEGVHSVLSAHSGVPTARLFTDLDKLEDGDEFQIQVLNQILTYRVYDIRVVLPTQQTLSSFLGQQPGKDLVTLVTCTPIGVNTHRLLVTGERVPTKQPLPMAFTEPGATDPGFPWWVLVIVGAFLLGVFVTRPLNRGVHGGGAAGASRSHRMPWIDIVYRPLGSKEYDQWLAHRSEVLGASGGASDEDGPGGYTWTLKNPQGVSLSISANVFPSQDAALDDARNNSKLAVRARNFTVHSSDISSRANGGMKISRSFWWASSTNRAGDNDSQFMSVNPVAAKDVEKNSNHALESLKIAHIDDGDAQQ